MPTITFDYRRWKRGSSSSPFVRDKGFSFATIGVDLLSIPGAAFPGVFLNAASKGTTLAQVLNNDIAAIALSDTQTDRDCAFLTVNSDKDGKLVKITAAATETVIAAADTGRDYAEGISDLVYYKGAWFWTSYTDIAKDDDYDWGTDVAGSSGLTSGVPHPLAVFEDFLVIADGNLIHYWDGSTYTEDALDLPEGFVITALESWRGFLWIHAERASANLEGSLTASSTLFYWDFINPDTYNGFVPLNQRISAMRVHRGQFYVWTPQSFGSFDGQKINGIFPMKSQIRKKDIAISGRFLFFFYPMCGIYTSGGSPVSTYFDRVACYGEIEEGGAPIVTFPMMNDYYGSTPIDGVKALVAYPESQKTGIRIFHKVQTLKCLRNVTFPRASFEPPTNSGYETSELHEIPIEFPSFIKLQRIRVQLHRTALSQSRFTFYCFDRASETVELLDIDGSGTYGVSGFYERAIENSPIISILRFFTQFNKSATGSASGLLSVSLDYEEVQGAGVR